VLAGEDIRFFYHSGVDFKALRMAMEKNWKERSLRRGGSTINQQLAKNLFLSPTRNPFRKFHEALIAWEMEFILGERRILEVYLNVIEWGDGIYGVEAASRHYFNVSAASLTPEQAAFLSAILPSPLTNYNPKNCSGELCYRINLVLILMRHPYLEQQPLLDIHKTPGGEEGLCPPTSQMGGGTRLWLGVPFPSDSERL
jgi:monofunctional biosynthetic peptidoglycan transglycosylase